MHTACAECMHGRHPCPPPPCPSALPHRRKPYEIDSQIDCAFPCATQVGGKADTLHAWGAGLLHVCRKLVTDVHASVPTHAATRVLHAVQNEVGEEEARQLTDHGCKYVIEGG